MALKPCGECKKQISGDANPCPHCGKKNPHGMSKLVKYGGGALVVVILIGVIAPSSKTKGSGGDAAELAPQVRSVPLAVDAVKLWKDYDANEVAADGVYKGKLLQVTGAVASIDKDILNDIVLHLKSPNPFMATMATLEKSEASKAAALTKESTVTLICKGKGRIMGSPVLGSCTIGS